MFKIDFSHITADNLQPFEYQSLFDVMPWQHLDKSVLDGINIDIDLNQHANTLFSQLKQGTMNLTVLDVLVLFTIPNPQWQFDNIAKVVADNWLDSVTDSLGSKALNATLMPVLQYHSNAQIYEKMSNAPVFLALKNAIYDNKSKWANRELQTIIGLVLNNDYEKLASFVLIDKKLSIKDFLKKYPLPLKKQSIETLRVHWLNSYLQLSEEKLSKYKKVIKNWLNEKSDIEFLVNRTKLIFDNPYFDKDLKKLESQTHKFDDIFKWLKKLSKNREFMQALQGLDNHYLVVLRAWLGAGNYYQLEKTVRKISQIHDEGNKISINRYLFWTNYQSYITDYLLLLPSSQKSLYDNMVGENTKWIAEEFIEFPIIVLILDEFVIIQPLVVYGADAELKVIKKSVMDSDGYLLQKSKEVSLVNLVDKYEPCLIHDFYYGWQTELVGYLEELGIHRSSDSIRFSDKTVVKIQDLTIDFGEMNKRQQCLKSWYYRSTPQNIIGQRSSRFRLKKHAKNLKYNNVI